MINFNLRLFDLKLS